MTVNYIKLLVCGALVAGSSFGALAAEGELANVTIRSIGAIGTAFGSHLAGNFEVTFDSPYVMPAGLNCSTIYVTTKRANDPDRLIFTMLREAKELKLKVGMRLSDASNLQAFPGRCSILAVGYAAQ